MVKKNKAKSKHQQEMYPSTKEKLMCTDNMKEI